MQASSRHPRGTTARNGDQLSVALDDDDQRSLALAGSIAAGRAETVLMFSLLSACGRRIRREPGRQAAGVSTAAGGAAGWRLCGRARRSPAPPSAAAIATAASTLQAA